MSIVVKNNIHWVGQRDWEVRDFHGTEYKTSTINSAANLCRTCVMKSIWRISITS